MSARDSDYKQSDPRDGQPDVGDREQLLKWMRQITRGQEAQNEILRYLLKRDGVLDEVAGTSYGATPAVDEGQRSKPTGYGQVLEIVPKKEPKASISGLRINEPSNSTVTSTFIDNAVHEEAILTLPSPTNSVTVISTNNSANWSDSEGKTSGTLSKRTSLGNLTSNPTSITTFNAGQGVQKNNSHRHSHPIDGRSPSWRNGEDYHVSTTKEDWKGPKEDVGSKYARRKSGVTQEIAQQGEGLHPDDISPLPNFTKGFVNYQSEGFSRSQSLESRYVKDYSLYSQPGILRKQKSCIRLSSIRGNRTNCGGEAPYDLIVGTPLIELTV